jgi:hypothetical protein
VHFTPTYSSWINQVERFFAYVTADLLQRSDHRSVQALEADIRAWITNWNANPQPFIWTKTADQILESIARLLKRINRRGTLAEALRGRPRKLPPRWRRQKDPMQVGDTSYVAHAYPVSSAWLGNVGRPGFRGRSSRFRRGSRMSARVGSTWSRAGGQMATAVHVADRRAPHC